MPHDLGIANRLRAYGLHTIECDGWQSRGSSSFTPRGAVTHHTADGKSGNIPSLDVLINGREGLAGPLCNIAQARDNTIYVVAAGRANHAGEGGWRGLSGNSSVWGLEIENVGTSAEPWRTDQADTAARAQAAMIDGTAGADMVCQHEEWAPTRKIDCHDVDGDLFRSHVAHFLGGGGWTPKPEVPELGGIEMFVVFDSNEAGRARFMAAQVGGCSIGLDSEQYLYCVQHSSANVPTIHFPPSVPDAAFHNLVKATANAIEG